MKVSQIMTMPVHSVEAETSLKEAAGLMTEHRVSGLPVVGEARRVVGVISESDFVKQEARRGQARGESLREGVPAQPRTVGEAMTRRVVTVLPDASVTEAARLMLSYSVRRLPVVDAQGQLLGVVSRSDVLRTFVRSDRQIEDEIEEQIVRNMLRLDPDSLDLLVLQGVVNLSGKLPTEAAILAEFARRVPGVVAVDDYLTWEADDQLDHGLASREIAG